MRTLLFTLTFLLPTPLTAETFGNKPVYVEGGIDCGDWLGSRQRKTSVAFEHYVLGMLNGLALGADREFWHADGRAISWDAAYFWVDAHCRSHPTDVLNAAVLTFFKERTGLQ